MTCPPFLQPFRQTISTNHLCVRQGFLTLDRMDAQTQADIHQLFTQTFSLTETLPCGPAGTEGTLKCEACVGGCQIWDVGSKC